MGKYTVPEEIRKIDRPKATVIKAISGHFYVYETSNVKRGDKWYTKSGKCIGKIDLKHGFVSNENSLRDEQVTALDFGEWATAIANSKDTLKLLHEHFSHKDACRIYIAALIHFVAGFSYMRDIKSYYDMSMLSIRFPNLKLGYSAISKLYEDLGRKDLAALSFQQSLITHSSNHIAIDGHVVPARSERADLAQKGYKFFQIGQEQINLLMAYDIETKRPLMSKFYEGAAADKIVVKDFIAQANLNKALFVIDRGFYSKENLALFTNNECHYVIPLTKSNKTSKQVIKDFIDSNTEKRFVYEKGKKSSVIEYEKTYIDNAQIIVYRDVREATMMQANYLRHLKRGDKGYTQQKFDELKDVMGVTVLQTSLIQKDACSLWELYKRRWSIETYFDYFKNGQDSHSFCMQNYYMLQGLAFVLLVSGLIYREVKEALDKSGLEMSIHEMIIEAKKVKVNKRDNRWVVCNCLKKRVEFFEKLNTELVAIP